MFKLALPNNHQFVSLAKKLEIELKKGFPNPLPLSMNTLNSTSDWHQILFEHGEEIFLILFKSSKPQFYLLVHSLTYNSTGNIIKQWRTQPLVNEIFRLCNRHTHNYK